MSEHKDEKWLDEQLQRAVDGATPTFNAEAWKQRYAREYETLVGRGQQSVGWGLPHRFLWSRRLCWGKPHPTGDILHGSFGKIAVAATIFVAASVLLVGRLGPTPSPQPVTPQAPAQMISMISLSAAFRRGGIDELDKQCDRALERLGPRPITVSVQELLKDISKG